MFGRQLFLIFFIGMVTTLATSSGYLMDHSAIFSSWNMTPPFMTVQNTSNEEMLNNNTHVDKMRKISIEELDIKHLDEIAVNESTHKTLLETDSTNTEEFSLTDHNDRSLRTDSNFSHLKNIILIFVDTVNQEKEEFWKNFERTYSFTVHGYLQVDNHDENGPMKVDLRKFLSPERKEDECECKETLRSNISELLTWAREIKKMSTSVLSAINFSIPATPEIEETFETVRNNDSSESSTKGTIPKLQLQHNDSTRLMDSYERDNSDSTIIITSNSKKESYDDMWDVIDMFTKIRIAFFRAMIDTLSGPSNGTMDDELSFRGLPGLRTSFVNSVDDALKNLRTVSSNEGYILVLAVPENELDSLTDLLHHQISLSDTLLVVTELCSKDTKRVSFFAKGTAASLFYRTRAIGELVGTIKGIVSQTCQEHGYNTNRQRHIRNTIDPIETIETIETIDSENITSVNKSMENKEILTNRAHDTLMKKMDTSSSSNVMYDTITTFLGMATSLIALITANSS